MLVTDRLGDLSVKRGKKTPPALTDRDGDQPCEREAYTHMGVRA